MTNLDWFSYIYYPILLQNDMGKIENLVLIDYKTKVNVIKSAYAAKLSLQVLKTDIVAQKINNSFLEIYGIDIAAF